jgi:hypothetical protein
MWTSYAGAADNEEKKDTSSGRDLHAEDKLHANTNDTQDNVAQSGRHLLAGMGDADTIMTAAAAVHGSAVEAAMEAAQDAGSPSHNDVADMSDMLSPMGQAAVNALPSPVGDTTARGASGSSTSSSQEKQDVNSSKQQQWQEGLNLLQGSLQNMQRLLDRYGAFLLANCWHHHHFTIC